MDRIGGLKRETGAQLGGAIKYGRSQRYFPDIWHREKAIEDCQPFVISQLQRLDSTFQTRQVAEGNRIASYLKCC